MTTNLISPKLLLQDANGITFSCPNDCFYLAYRGSKSHGMFVPSTNPDSIDDIDLMGFCTGSPHNYFGLNEWGSRGTKEFKQGQYDVVLYEIRKAVSLLLQGNPNILSMLWVDPRHRLIQDPVTQHLFNARSCFIGKHVYNAFAGYAHQQMEKMESRDPAELREYIAVTDECKARGIHPNHKGELIPLPDRVFNGEDRDVVSWSADKLLQKLKSFQKKGENIGYMGDKRKQLVLQHGFDCKNAAHLIRLLRMCIEFLNTGELIVNRPDASELLDIKLGKWTLAQVKSHADDLWKRAKSARANSTLPESPDRIGAERMLVNLIKSKLYD